MDKKQELEKSFTLIETLVTVAVFGLIMGVVASFVVSIYKVHGYSWQQSIAINEARKGIETMTREIREAREGDDGSYAIELANDKEFIFYSDMDQDGETERVRYFLGSVSSGNQVQNCVTFSDGGSCSVDFTGFLEGVLESATLQVSVEGDFSHSREYAEIFVDGQKIDNNFCKFGCSDCAYEWQGTATYDVAEQAADNNLQVIADANRYVNDFCDWEQTNHAMKANFELEWMAGSAGSDSEFKKGVINPVGEPATYPIEQEEVWTLSSYVRNVPPIFRYFDANGQEIIETPARLIDTKVMRVYLIINVNPNRSPQDFELESTVKLRNL